MEFNRILHLYRLPIMAFSIISIMLYHQGFIPGTPLSDFFHIFGHWGVDVFLLISGWGIVHSLNKNPLKKFFRNRAMRLLPTCIFIGVIQTIWFSQTTGYLPLYKQLLALRPLSLDQWFVEGIIIYYLLSPVFKTLIERYRYWPLVAAVVFGTVFNAFPLQEDYYLVRNMWWITSRFPSYLAGMYIAIYPIKVSNRKLFYMSLPLLALNVLLRYLQIVYMQGSMVEQSLLFLSTPLVCLVFYKLYSWLQRIPYVGQAIVFIGSLTLELYLWHAFLAAKLLIGMKGYVALLLFFIASIVFSFISKKIVDFAVARIFGSRR